MNTKETTENLSPLDYTYSPGSKVEVPASFFMALQPFLVEMKERGIEPTYTNVKEDGSIMNEEEFNSQKPKLVMSQAAFIANKFLGIMEDIHISNIREGKAVKISDLNNGIQLVGLEKK